MGNLAVKTGNSTFGKMYLFPINGENLYLTDLKDGKGGHNVCLCVGRYSIYY